MPNHFVAKTIVAVIALVVFSLAYWACSIGALHISVDVLVLKNWLFSRAADARMVDVLYLIIIHAALTDWLRHDD